MRLSICVAALSALSMAASAAELGALSVVSHVGETFDARLQVLDVKEDASVEIGLGSATYYHRIGKAMAPELKSMKVTRKFDTSGRVRIVGQEVMNTEEFALVVVMRDGGKTKAKVYNIKLGAARQGVNAEKKSEVQEKTEVKDAVSASENVSPQGTAPTKKVVREANTESKNVGKKNTEGKAKAEIRRTVLVKPGMTMWSLAKQTQKAYPKATVNQVLVAIVRANPSAFEGGKPSRVKVGTILLLPSARQVARVGQLEAMALIQVKPEANALKKPSKARLKEARAMMAKTKPEKVAKPVVPEKPKPVAKPELTSTDAMGQLQQKLEAERQTTAPQSAVQPAETALSAKTQTAQASLAQPTPKTPESQSVTESAKIESVSAKPKTEAEKSVATPNAEKPSVQVVKPAPTQVEKKVETVVAKAPAKKTEAKNTISLNKLLLAVVAAALAFLGGFGLMRRRKAKRAQGVVQQTRMDSPRVTELKPVAFTRDQGAQTTNEQIAGIDATVQQRMESDRYASRGFELKGERMGVAPTVTTPVSVAPAREPLAPSVEKSVAVGVPEGSPRVSVVPETNAQDRAKAAGSGEASQPEPSSNPQAPVSPVTDAFKASIDESMEQKLAKARGYIAASLSDRAIALLEEIALKGNEEQRAAAMKLLTGLK